MGVDLGAMIAGFKPAGKGVAFGLTVTLVLAIAGVAMVAYLLAVG